MTDSKPNCYECIYRRNVPGDAHSSCAHPTVEEDSQDMISGIAAILSGRIKNDIGVQADPHGVKSGWFLWPVNFDPVWLKACKGFQSHK